MSSKVCRERKITVLFTHELNQLLLAITDRVLYLGTAKRCSAPWSKW